MKMLKKIIIVLSALIAVSFTAAAESVPYENYTYSEKNGNLVYGPQAYLPECVITGSELGLANMSSLSDIDSDEHGNLYLLARLVYGEARGEPYKGQVAVAAVVLNRVKSSQFPNSVSGVIYQSGAFSVVNDGQINLTPDETAIKAARDAMNGYDPTNGCLYYYNPAKTTNQWMLSKPVLLVIGNHSFFK